MKVFTTPYKTATIYKGKTAWYIYYHYRHPQTEQWVMFKDRGGLNYKNLRNNPSLRIKAAENLRDAYNERLKAGWSPYGVQPQQSSEYDILKFMPAIKVLAELQKIKQNTIKRRTWQSYKYSLDVFTRWLKAVNLQHIMLAALQQKHMLQFFDSLQSSGKFKNKSINNHAANLGVLFNAAVERELCTKNPIKGYKKLPEESGKNYPFSQKQKEKLKAKILKHDPDLWLFVKCIYHLFVRPIELLRIKISDVDLRTGQIIIHSSAGKNKKQMAVEIPQSFIPEIKALQLKQYPEHWYLFGMNLKRSEKPYHRNRVTARHTAILKACGITDANYSMYGWKHTGNIDSYLAGIDVYDLMRQNRHHSLEQTMNYLRSMGLRPNVNYSKKAPAL